MEQFEIIIETLDNFPALFANECFAVFINLDTLNLKKKLIR